MSHGISIKLSAWRTAKYKDINLIDDQVLNNLDLFSYLECC